MKKYSIIVFAFIFGWIQAGQATTSSVPSESEDVMLQGFYWNSYQSSAASGRTKWIDLLKDTTDLREHFDLIWLPPSAAGGGVGYYPKRWSSQDGDWGSKSNLKLLIQALHRGGTKVIADIVVNHHASSSGWGNFSVEDFGSYGSYQLTQEHICAGDEAFTDSKSDLKGSSTHGANDTGDNDAGCRDLDHTSTYVQECVKAYVQWMRTEMGYDGFRYDMVKGYHGRYVAMYNEAAQPEFSVGECFDGSLAVLKNYVNAAEQTTMVFDFATKFNVFNNGIGSSSYGALKQDKQNKLHRDAEYGKYAVTFVDNHDTFGRGEGNEYCDPTSTGKSITTKEAKVLEANAYLLSMPGVPCVFYPHWAAFKDEISLLIEARKRAGIHSESVVISEQTGGPYRYEAVIEGHHGRLMLRLGSQRETAIPDGYVLFASGSNYDVYLESALTDVPQMTAKPEVKKIIENGRICILRDGVRYDALGRKL